jgi:ribosomal protein L14
MVESLIKSVYNSVGILFKCIRVFVVFNRRYAKLCELLSAVSSTRKSYRKETNKIKLAKLAKKVKKKRKIKNKKKKQPSLRPYLALLVALKKATKRRDGSYLKSDRNLMLTFTEPTKFGPAGKSENIPNFLGTKVYSPVPL